MLQSGKTADSLAQWAEASNRARSITWSGRPRLLLTLLPQLASAAEGQGVMQMEGSSAQVFYVESRRAEPVTLEQARNAIQAAITNERKRQAALNEVNRLRAAAKVEYVVAPPPSREARVTRRPPRCQDAPDPRRLPAWTMQP
jgi:hypothetical protein